MVRGRHRSGKSWGEGSRQRENGPGSPVRRDSKRGWWEAGSAQSAFGGPEGLQKEVT